MIITLEAKPLSVNMAYQGRRYSTKAKEQFESLMRWLLPKPEKLEGKWLRIEYHFFLRNFSLTDADNCVKVLQDCLVKRGIILDDRQIIDYRIRKYPSTRDHIIIEIAATELIEDWTDGRSHR